MIIRMHLYVVTEMHLRIGRDVRWCMPTKCTGNPEFKTLNPRLNLESHKRIARSPDLRQAAPNLVQLLVHELLSSSEIALGFRV